MSTNIQWVKDADGHAGHTWNPVRGCSRVSEGCRNCYAERQAARALPGMRFSDGSPLAVMRESGPRWTGRVELQEHMLDIPLRRKKPTTYFVNSMSDLFHEDLPDHQIAQVFAIMQLAKWHTFQVLTKRAKRMYEWHQRNPPHTSARVPFLPNVWLGVSCEDQATADERIPHLLRTPAAVRFLSAEPLLGPLRLWKLCSPDYHENTIGYETYPLDGMQAYPDCDWEHPKLDWVIVGGESGPRARPMNLQWARDIIAQCREAKVPVFFKQAGAAPFVAVADKEKRTRAWPYSKEVLVPSLLGERIFTKLRDKKGGTLSELPCDLCVRELPRPAAMAVSAIGGMRAAERSTPESMAPQPAPFNPRGSQ